MFKKSISIVLAMMLISSIIAINVSAESANTTYCTVGTSVNDGTLKGSAGANHCSNGDTLNFVDGLDSTIKEVFSSATDDTKVDPEKVTSYMNYLGTKKGSYLYMDNITLSKGTYNVYFLGYNNDGNDMQLTVNEGENTIATVDLPGGSGVNIATKSSNASATLKVFKFAVNLPSDVSNATIKINNTTGEWLPDAYEVAIKSLTTPNNIYYPYGSLSGGNSNAKSSTDLTYLSSFTNEEIKSVLADPTDSTKIRSSLVAGYWDYLGNNNNNSKGKDLTLPIQYIKQGSYNAYIIGCCDSNSNNDINVNLGDTQIGTIKKESAQDILGPNVNSSNKTTINLKLYTISFTASSDLTNQTLTLWNKDNWFPDVYSVVISKQPGWNNASDKTFAQSGYYLNGNTKEGIIRFFQGFEQSDVTEYGFYFVDANGVPISTVTTLSGDTLSDTNQGFYGDLIEIPDLTTDTFYAKAYVIIDGIIYWNNSSISSTVDWNTLRPSPSN